MKLVGKIHGQDVIILVDSGATHNFISSTLAHHLQLPIKKTKGFEVTIGNGQQVSGSEVCKEVRIDVQGVQINQQYFLYELRGTDVVLGMEWLTLWQYALVNQCYDLLLRLLSHEIQECLQLDDNWV